MSHGHIENFSNSVEEDNDNEKGARWWPST